MSLLRSTRISHRLLLLTLLTVLPFLAMNIATLMHSRTSLVEQKKLKTRHVVETAHSLLRYHEEQAASGLLSVADAQAAAKEAIKQLRYEEAEYFWINDMQVRMVMHPYKPQLDGKDMSTFEDPVGNRMFVDMVAAARDGGGFVDYMWPKPGAEEPVPKVSYVKPFEPWGWVIGSGIYIDDVDQIFWAQVRERGLWNLLIIALVVVIGLYISRGIVGPLRKARDVARNIADGDLTCAIEIERQDETGDMLEALSTMQSQLLERIEKNAVIAAETDRLKRALDKSAARVMVTDNSHKIIYVNSTAEEMFRMAADDLRSDLPGFDPGELVGAGIDAFQVPGSQQPGLPRSAVSEHGVTLRLGGHIFEVICNAIDDADKQHVGMIFEWSDITEQRRVEDEVASVVNSVMAGDLSKRIPLSEKDGVFAKLSEGINSLVGICDQVIDDTVRILGGLAQGDLNETISTEYAGAFADIKTNANTTMARLSEVIRDVKFGAQTITGHANEISQGTSDLAGRIEQQSARLEHTASSMVNITSTVKQNADSAEKANELAASARQQAGVGGEVVNQTVAAMAEINRSSEKISDITNLIDEIAFQTNLLALNAAVEAARAGDQGRGFAVVASEVRGLAQRSAGAAKEIKTLIDDSVQKVNEGSRLVDKSGHTLEEIVTSVTKVSNFIAEIATSSREQSHSIDEVSQAVSNMDRMTQQNAALVEEAAGASQSMSDQASRVNDVMGFFKVGDEPRGERRGEQRPWSVAS